MLQAMGTTRAKAQSRTATMGLERVGAAASSMAVPRAAHSIPLGAWALPASTLTVTGSVSKGETQTGLDI